MLLWKKKDHVTKEEIPSDTDKMVTRDEITTKGLYGLSICHDDDDAVADIVFVHGLTGNRENTWTSKETKVFWPRDLLPKDLPKTRIMTYGYDADIAHFWSMASQNRIGEHASNLVNAIAQVRERTDTEGRPIVFVTHSLGGLVTEDALLFSKNSAEDHLQDVVKSVTGICFLGTPHCGADLARWGSVVAGLANVIKKANVDLVNVLKTDSEVLARVQREFHTMLRGRTMGEGRPPLNITCFFEELPVRGAGEIVPKHSAILASYNHIGIRANHMDMTKFNDANDPGYHSVSGELRRWVKAIAKRCSDGRRSEHGASPYSQNHDLHGLSDWNREGARYNGGLGGYPMSDQAREEPPFAGDGRGFQSYPEDARRYATPPQRQYPFPSPQVDHPGYRSHSTTPSYRPQYQQYRSGGYTKPTPPPVPEYIDEAQPPMPPPMFAQEPAIDRSPPHQNLSPEDLMKIWQDTYDAQIRAFMQQQHPPSSQERRSPPSMEELNNLDWGRGIGQSMHDAYQRPPQLPQSQQGSLAGRAAQHQQNIGSHQGGHTISGNSTTYGDGKTVQGVNLNVQSGNVSF